MDLFTLVAKIKLDDSEYTNGISKATSSGEAFSTKLASFGKAAAVGLAAAATAVTAIGTAAIKGYADYEQLIGGVETLFKSSASIVEGYANVAYQTAGLSANKYMETVTGFSASLLQSLGGDTAAAAEAGNMAVIDMADNANKMGTSIESIQYAYQGFAKQNYTMLDNLKLGYGGTKEEMERLLDDAEKISGVHYDISNLNDVYQAVHVIQTELGITGTTALEASTTISGSFNSLKAAWSNVLTGMADDNADFSDLINKLVDAASTFGGNILPRIETALTGVVDLVVGLAPQIIGVLPNLVAQLLPAIIGVITGLISAIGGMLPQAVPALLESAITAVSELLISLGEILPELMPQIVETIVNTLVTLLSNVDLFIQAGMQLISGLVVGIINAIPVLLEAVPQIITALINGLINSIPMLIEMAPQIIIGIITGLIQALPQIIIMAPQIIIALINGLIQALPLLISFMPQVINSIVDAFNNTNWIALGVQVFMEILNGLESMFPGITSSVLGFIGNLANLFSTGDWAGAGRAIIDGIWQGISSGWSWLIGQVQSLPNNLVSIFRDVLGIHSPSRVFAQLGQMTAEGFGIGFDDTFSNVQKSINNSIDFSTKSGKYNGNSTNNGSSVAPSGGITLNIATFNNYTDDDIKTLSEKIMQYSYSYANRNLAAKGAI